MKSLALRSGSLCKVGAMEKKCIISSPNIAQDLNVLLSIPDLANKAHLHSKDMSCFGVLCLLEAATFIAETHEMLQTEVEENGRTPVSLR